MVELTEKQKHQRLINFLGGTFHQDAGSAELALADFLNKVSKETLRTLVEIIKEFLGSKLNQEEKNNFIERYVESYFPYELEAVEWLEKITGQINEALERYPD